MPQLWCYNFTSAAWYLLDADLDALNVTGHTLTAAPTRGLLYVVGGRDPSQGFVNVVQIYDIGRIRVTCDTARA